MLSTRRGSRAVGFLEQPEHVAAVGPAASFRQSPLLISLLPFFFLRLKHAHGSQASGAR